MFLSTKSQKKFRIGLSGKQKLLFRSRARKAGAVTRDTFTVVNDPFTVGNWCGSFD